MVPIDLRSTPVDKARSGFICTMETLAKGCHKLWVTRHTSNKKIGPKRIRNIAGEMEEDCKSDSEASWKKNLFGENPTQLLSLDDENTPLQDGDDETKNEGEQNGDIASAQGEDLPSQEVGEGEYTRVHRKRINVDYKKRKSQKRQTHVVIGYQKATITGNPHSSMARVEVGYDVGMGVSVYVKGSLLHNGDCVTHYAVKRTLTVEEYAAIYNNKSIRRPHSSVGTRIICIRIVKLNTG